MGIITTHRCFEKNESTTHSPISAEIITDMISHTARSVGETTALMFIRRSVRTIFRALSEICECTIIISTKRNWISDQLQTPFYPIATGMDRIHPSYMLSWLNIRQRKFKTVPHVLRPPFSHYIRTRFVSHTSRDEYIIDEQLNLNRIWRR